MKRSMEGKRWALSGAVLGVILLLAQVQSASAYTLTVSGTIDMQFQGTANYHAMKQIKVEIWDIDVLFDDKVGDTNTNDSGSYSKQITSGDSWGPDILVRAILEDKDSEVAEVEDGGNEIYLDSDEYEDQTTDVTINVRFSNGSGKNDEANLYRVAYDAIKSTAFGTKTMDQLHLTRDCAADQSFFETTDLDEIHIGSDHVWYAYGDDDYGPWTICHETGHAIMWAMYDHEWPNPYGTAPSPHHMDQAAGRGFAWTEGWANIYGSEKDGKTEGSANWHYDNPEANLYWTGKYGEYPPDGTNNSGLAVEGAIASAGYLIGYSTIWPEVREHGKALDSFEDVWDCLSKTQAQRVIVERNNMIFFRGKLTEIRCEDNPWHPFTDGYELPPDCSGISFRAHENTEGSLNLEAGEEEAATAMVFSYRSVTSLSDKTTWYPYNTGWTAIGVDTAKSGDNWEVTGWTSPAGGNYWVRVQTRHAGNTDDSLLPGDPSGETDTPFEKMREWNRNTLKTVLYLKIDDAAACDPVFIQADRRNPAAVYEAQAERKRELERIACEREVKRLLRLLDQRVSE